jgi:hypothetical protein
MTTVVRRPAYTAFEQNICAYLPLCIYQLQPFSVQTR